MAADRYRIRVRVEYADCLDPSVGILDGGHPLPYLIARAVFSGRLPLCPGRFIEVDEADLQACCAPHMWDGMLVDLQSALQLEVERKTRRGGQWEPLSYWRLDELRKARDLAAALRAAPLGAPPRTAVLDIAAVVGEMRQVVASAPGRKPGRSLIVWHLSDHVGLSRSQILDALKQLGELDVRPNQIAGYRHDGRKPQRPCPFIDP